MTLDPWKPYEFFVEEECSAAGPVLSVATVFLTNRQCPWRCVMCDLWRNTLSETVPLGAIPAQIDFALSRLAPARQIKLYNAGSFFDIHAIPPGDYAAIATRIAGFERVIVESHPALIGERCFQFRDLLGGRLEVAMGLETVHPEVLPKLNKGMTLEQFSGAAGRLRQRGIDLRVFILVQPPFLAAADAVEWAARSLDFAFDCGATAATLIPTRGFEPPRMSALEASLEYGIELKRGRVFADLWDLQLSGICPACREARVERLRRMNLSQQILESVRCDACAV